MPVEDSEAFCAIARQQIVNARMKLALGQLSIGEESELWQIVECIEALVGVSLSGRELLYGRVEGDG